MRLLISLLLCSIAGAQVQSKILRVIPDSTRANVGQLQFLDKQITSHKLIFQAPDTVAADVTWVLPSSDAVGCLGSDGAGNLSFGGCTIGHLLINPSLSAANLILRDALGTTTGNAFEVQKNDATTVFKVLGATDATYPGFVFSKAHLPLVDSVYTLGDATHQWSTIYADGFNLTGNSVVQSPGAMAFLSGSTVGFNSGSFFNLNTPIIGNVIPSVDATYSIGDNTHHWNTIYADGFNLIGNSVLTSPASMAFLTGSTVGFNSGSFFNLNTPIIGNVTPSVDATYSLGTSSFRWTKLWANDFDLTGTATFNAAVAFHGGITLDNGVISTVTGLAGMDFLTGSTFALESGNNFFLRTPVTGNILPSVDATYNIGSGTLGWSSVFSHSFVATDSGIAGPYMSFQNSHATSANTNLLFSRLGTTWYSFGTDPFQAGTRNFFLYDFVNAKLRMLIDSAGKVNLQPNGGDTTTSSIYPNANAAYTSGLSGNRWSKVWTNDIDSDGQATMANATFSGVTTFTGLSTHHGGITLDNGVISTVTGLAGMDFLTGSTFALESGNTFYLRTPIVGNAVPSASATYTLGNGSFRWSKVWTNDIDSDGQATMANATFSGTTTFTGTSTHHGGIVLDNGVASLVSNFAALGFLSGTTFSLNSGSFFNLNTSITGNIIPSSDNTYTIGNTSFRPSRIFSRVIEVSIGMIMNGNPGFSGTYAFGTCNATFTYGALTGTSGTC